MKNAFEPSRKIEIAYEREIRRLIGKAFPRKRPGQTIEEWIAELRSLTNSARFSLVSETIARQMVHAANVRNAKAWQQHSRLIYRTLQKELSGSVGAKYEAIIRQNAQLIRSVPAEVAQRLSARLARAQIAGVRAETAAKQIAAEYPQLTDWKCRLIARTEVSKASAALTEVRAREIGIGWTQWKTSRDGAVRRSHRHMEGVLMSWDDPPSPEELIGEKSTLGHYLAGCAPNCRCSSFPVVTLNDVSWPRKVYMQGAIVQMTRAQFAAMAGIAEKVAA